MHRERSWYTLAQSLGVALQEGGPSILGAPKRLIAYAMDLADAESREVSVFAGNCDEDLLVPYVRAVREGTPEALEWAANHSTVLLTERRFLVEDVSRNVARAIASSVAYVLGVALPADYGSAVIPYDVFVCCREVIEPTGVRTDDGRLAMRASDAMKRAGLRVFYPRVALVRDAIEQHDALTRDALVSSRVLLFVCSDARHAQSAWVQDQLRCFRAMHATEPDRIVVCLWGHDADQLPADLRMESPFEATADALPNAALQRIEELAQRPVVELPAGMPVRSGDDSSLGATRGVEWVTTNDVRYRVEDALTADGPIRLVVVRPIGLGGKDITVTYDVEGTREKGMIRGMSIGDEGLVAMSAGARLVSVMTRNGDETLRSFAFAISWRQVSLTDNELVLRFWNRSHRTCALSDVMMCLECTASAQSASASMGTLGRSGASGRSGALARSGLSTQPGTSTVLLRLGSHGILVANETRKITVQLDEWSAAALRRAETCNMYVFGRKVPSA